MAYLQIHLESQLINIKFIHVSTFAVRWERIKCMGYQKNCLYTINNVMHFQFIFKYTVLYKVL